MRIGTFTVEATVPFLAQLFSKKTSRYCHSPVIVSGVVVAQKLLHFLISLSLLKIFT